MLPVDEVRIDPVKVNDIGLGKSIYTCEQLEEFARFQDSQGTRKAYLAEMAYSGRSEKGEWGLALSSAAQGSLIDIVGATFFPLYRVVGLMIFFLLLLLLVWGGFRLIVTVLLRVIIIVRCKGCRIWVLTALWGTLFQLAISPFSWVDAAMEGCWRESRPNDGNGGCPGAGGQGDEKKEQERGGIEKEVLVVAKWPHEGGALLPSPHHE
jgi:hypothetical protein